MALATLGVVLTALTFGVFAHLFLGLTFLEGLLLGSIVSSTGAAAVFVALRLPPEFLVDLIARGKEYLVPGGGTTLAAGDTLPGMTGGEAFSRVKAQARATG